MKTPVLFLVYNRPQYTEKVFEAIRKAKPERLFISADGPKSGRSADIQLCEEVRRIVTKVDWPCTVKALLRKENLGCKQGISGGMNWFFDHVEQGIILEDDCLPNKSFFQFCEMMLEKYRRENKIMMIAGSNPATSVNIEENYLFSRFYTIWGWATWKRAWNKFDINITAWPKLKADRFLETVFKDNIKNRHFIERMFDDAYGNEKCSVWSLQWTFACLVNDAFAIIPKHNLVSNIGLVGTHEMNNNQLFLKEKKINFSKFLYPKQIKIDQNIENLFFEKSGLE